MLQATPPAGREGSCGLTVSLLLLHTGLTTYLGPNEAAQWQDNPLCSTLVPLTLPARRRGGRGLTVCLLLPHTGLAAFPSGASQSQSPLTHFCESTASAVCTLLTILAGASLA